MTQITFNEETKRYCINANAEMFIIPNSAGRVTEFISKERAIREAQSICSSVGKDFDENDPLVQVWICSDDLDTENLCRHGATVEIEGEDYFLEYPEISEYIPLSIIKDLKEGETATFGYTNIATINNNDKNIKVDLMLNVKANQLDYRYSRFGTFESVLSKVCAHC